MANNNIIFNAALAGLTGGAVDSRWLTSNNPANYSALNASAVALATQIDALIPANPGIGASQARLMQSICQAIFDSRAVGTNAPAAAVIVALGTAIGASMLSESSNTSVRYNVTANWGTIAAQSSAFVYVDISPALVLDTDVMLGLMNAVSAGLGYLVIGVYKVGASSFAIEIFNPSAMPVDVNTQVVAVTIFPVSGTDIVVP